MIRKIFFSCLVFAAISNVANALPVNDLQELLREINTMSADFSQTVYSEDGVLLQEYKGQMDLKKPDLLRWETNEPDRTLVVTDGNRLWNYDVELEQVTVQDREEDNQSPLAYILNDIDGIEKEYTVELSQDDCYALIPATEKTFDKIEMCFAKGKLTQLVIHDSLGQISTFDFYKIKLNKNIPLSRFKFTPPKGVDVIGGI